MRRYKITVSQENKTAGIFSDHPVWWDVVDTKTGRRKVLKATRETAVECAKRLEAKTV